MQAMSGSSYRSDQDRVDDGSAGSSGISSWCYSIMVITGQSLSDWPVTAVVTRWRTNACLCASVAERQNCLTQPTPALDFENKCPLRIDNVGLRQARIAGP